MMCSRGEQDTVGAFNTALSCTLALVGSSSSYICCERGRTLCPPHACTRTSKKGAQAHRGICVTGYTHFFSAGARSCCQFGEKRRRAPGVWPLLSSPLPDSSQFSSPLVSQSCYLPHDSSSLISFSTSTQPPCSLASRLNAECSGVPLSVLCFFRVTSTSHMEPLFCSVTLRGYF